MWVVCEVLSLRCTEMDSEVLVCHEHMAQLPIQWASALLVLASSGVPAEASTSTNITTMQPTSRPSQDDLKTRGNSKHDPLVGSL